MPRAGVLTARHADDSTMVGVEFRHACSASVFARRMTTQQPVSETRWKPSRPERGGLRLCLAIGFSARPIVQGGVA